MRITSLIDRNVTGTSVLEEIYHVSEWLKETAYLAVADEDLKIVGIVTLKDIHPHNHGLILDCNFIKPAIPPDSTVTEAFKMMKEANTDFLPVYERDDFVGVISLQSLTEGLAEILQKKEYQYQKVLHDLRNPIYNFQGLTNILNISQRDQENQELLKLCDLSCKHALDILEDLLFVEMNDSRPLNKISVDLNEFYQQCIKEQLGLCVLKNIQVENDFDKATIFKKIDINQIKRAVQNVFANAVKFSAKNSIIKVSTKAGDGYLTLKIVDSGIGIPLRLQPYIFDKFSSAQRPGTNGESSTGLGLCFSRQCIEQHEGIIYFKSEEGKGTNFYIRL